MTPVAYIRIITVKVRTLKLPTSVHATFYNGVDVDLAVGQLLMAGIPAMDISVEAIPYLDNIFDILDMVKGDIRVRDKQERVSKSLASQGLALQS